MRHLIFCVVMLVGSAILVLDTWVWKMNPPLSPWTRALEVLLLVASIVATVDELWCRYKRRRDHREWIRRGRPVSLANKLDR